MNLILWKTTLPMCLMFLLGGCNLLAYPAYLLAPDPGQKSIDAEYPRLPGHGVAVVLFIDEGIDYEHPALRRELSNMIVGEMKKNVKNVRMVPTDAVIRYQKANLDWENTDRCSLGKALSAEYVLYVAVDQFSTREPGSSYLYRGHISAEVKLYDTSKKAESEAVVWQTASLQAAYPKDDPVGQVNKDDRMIQSETVHEFGLQLARKFYKHKADDK